MNRPPDILRIGFDASVIRGRRTGVEYYALRLLEALRNAPGGHKIIAFSDRPVDGLPDAVVAPSRLPTALWRQLVLPGLARRAGVASFHSPVTAFPLAMPVPAAATVHDIAYLTAPECYGPRERLLQRFWLRRALARAAAVVCVSQATRDAVAARFPRAAAKLRVIRNGAVAMPAASFSVLPSSVSAPCPPQTTGHGPRTIPDRPFLLAVGRIERRKNPVRTLEAFLAATAAAPALQNCRLLFAGRPGNAAEALTAAIARHPEAAGRVERTDYAGEAELAWLYAEASALLYLSLDEGFGHPPLEALALGTPVVAADIPVLREVLEDAAEFAPPTDVPSMAAAIRRVLTDSARRQSLLAAGRRRLAELTWEKTAAEILALHRSLT
jgi:glycosyltransferase involved in cell wall biosynthesis